MNVAAVIVTRGDVELTPITGTVPVEGGMYAGDMGSLPAEWERIIWDNGARLLTRWKPGSFVSWWRGNEHTGAMQDLSVYGRYAAIEHTDADLIYVQDDDVIVSDPQAIFDAWQPGHVVCNMPPQFRHEGYTDSALVGFGACFERDLPARAFEVFGESDAIGETDADWPPGFFNRTCDVVFTTLTPRILVDVPKADREFASAPNRMWKQPDHYGERVRMLELARQVRDRVPA